MRPRHKVLPMILRLLLLAALLMGIACDAHALRITSYHVIATFDIAEMGIIDPSLRPLETEAITVEPDTNRIWFTGANAGKSYVYQATADIFTGDLTFVRRFETGFYDASQGGNLAEGIAFESRTVENGIETKSLLVSLAPDEDNLSMDPGVYRFVYDGVGAPTMEMLFQDDRLEGLSLDSNKLWAVDEGDDELALFDPTKSAMGVDITAPEGGSVFGDDLLLVDDLNSQKMGGVLVQYDVNGNPIPGESIETMDSTHFEGFDVNGNPIDGRLRDPQGAAFDEIRDLVYVIGDADNRITILTPEPAASLVFAAQALVATAALRRRPRRA